MDASDEHLTLARYARIQVAFSAEGRVPTIPNYLEAFRPERWLLASHVQSFTIMRRRRSLGLALAVVLIASGCNPDSQDASRSEPSSAQASSSATSSGTSSSTPQAMSSGAPPAGSSGSAGILDVSWVGPTTNADGSPLTDLAFYRLYFDTASTPCSGSAFFQVPSPTTSPQINDTVTYGVTGLLAGARYFAAVTAVDSNGLERDC